MRVLHLLSQQPGRTGSGVTLDALVREAGRAGWEQWAVVGLPGPAPAPRVGDLPADRVEAVRFDGVDLPYPIPGMSDVMPYASSRWRDLSAADLGAYRQVWTARVRRVVRTFRPQVVHVHHLWILASLVKDVAPDVPVVVHAHATGLRQMAFCRHLAGDVRRGLARCERFLALTTDMARRIRATLDVPAERVVVVGAGFRHDVFRPGAGDRRDRRSVLYAGKLSRAKGLPWLLDAFERRLRSDPGRTLHVAGGGGGPEAEALRARMAGLFPAVVAHGPLESEDLADVMRRSAVFVLPSFYEGLPLVLLEAAACGCRVVCTDLPTVCEDVAPVLGPWLETVPLPRLVGEDEPAPADLPDFTAALERGLETALEAAAGDPPPALDLSAFTWRAVFSRLEAVWRALARL